MQYNDSIIGHEVGFPYLYPPYEVRTGDTMV